MFTCLFSLLNSPPPAPLQRRPYLTHFAGPDVTARLNRHKSGRADDIFSSARSGHSCDFPNSESVISSLLDLSQQRFIHPFSNCVCFARSYFIHRDTFPHARPSFAKMRISERMGLFPGSGF